MQLIAALAARVAAGGACVVKAERMASFNGPIGSSPPIGRRIGRRRTRPGAGDRGRNGHRRRDASLLYRRGRVQVRISRTGQGGQVAIQAPPAAIVLDIGLPIWRTARRAPPCGPTTGRRAVRDGQGRGHRVRLELGGGTTTWSNRSTRESWWPGCACSPVRRSRSAPAPCSGRPGADRSGSATGLGGEPATIPPRRFQRRQFRRRGRHCQDRHRELYAPRNRTHGNRIRSAAVLVRHPRRIRRSAPRCGAIRRRPGRERLTFMLPRCARNWATPARSGRSAASVTRRMSGDRSAGNSGAQATHHARGSGHRLGDRGRGTGRGDRQCGGGARGPSNADRCHLPGPVRSGRRDRRAGERGSGERCPLPRRHLGRPRRPGHRRR